MLFDESEIWMYAKNIDMDLVHKINEKFKITMVKLELEKITVGRIDCHILHDIIWDNDERKAEVIIRYNTDGKTLAVNLENKGDNEIYRKIDKICMADQFSREVEPDGPYGIDTWRRYITL